MNNGNAERTPPDLILYDVGDTLLETRGYDPTAGISRLLSLARNPRHVTVDEILPLTLELNEIFDARCEATGLEYSQQAFHRLLYNHFDIDFDVSPQDLELAYWRHALSFAAEPGVADALEAARTAGCRQGVISNTSFSQETLRQELSAHGLDTYFELILASADIGLRKPHPRIFAAALGRAGVPAERAWYVGNTIRYDVRGAAAAGLRPVWYNKKEERGDLPPGTVEIRSWQEFPSLIDREVATTS
jgi:putative hydrolase of the HAD superfamily